MYRQSMGVRGFTLAALMAAVTTVFTLAVRIPVAASGGYFNLSDVAIFFAALSFGPWVGFIAGGLGTGLADIIGGYPEFAILSFFAHGLEGLVVGAVAQGKPVRTMILGWFAGAFLMCSIYFIGESVAYGGVGVALADLLTANIWQALAGGIIGVPLTLAVRRAYPLVAQAATPRRFREE